MVIRYVYYGSIIVLLSLGVGCGQLPISDEKVQPTSYRFVSKEEARDETSEALQKELMDFFNRYFSFTETELYAVGQYTLSAREEEQTLYQAKGLPAIRKRIGPYLSSELSQLMDTPLFQERMVLPKWQYLDSYSVLGTGIVEQVEVGRPYEVVGGTEYDVVVTVQHNSYSENLFKQYYGWDEVRQVFEVLPREGIGARAQVLDLMAPSCDVMRLRHTFKVRLETKEPLKITNLEVAGGWKVERAYQNSPYAIQHLERMPYQEVVSEEIRTLVSDFIEALMAVPKDYYGYYKRAYETNPEVFRSALEQLGLSHLIREEGINDLNSFPPSLLPCSESVAKIVSIIPEIQVMPSIYSTRNEGVYDVTFTCQALLHTQEQVYYNYKYQLGIREDQIQWAKLITSERI